MMKTVLNPSKGHRLLVVLLLSAILTIPGGFMVSMSRAAETSDAVISPIVLGLGDSVKISNYTIQFFDVSTNWSLVTMKVSYPGGVQLLFLREGETGYFPSESAPVLGITVNAIDSLKARVVISLESPHKIYRDSLQMVPNETVVLRKDLALHLFDSWQNGAKIGVRLPPLQDFEAFNISKGEIKAFDYQLSSGETYRNYLLLELVDASPEATLMRVYLPVLDAENLTLTTIPSGNGSQPINPARRTYVEVYRDYLIGGEKVKIDTGRGLIIFESTNYETSSLGTKIGFKVTYYAPNGSVIIKTFTLAPFSGLVTIDDVPLMFRVFDVDEHGRVRVSLYAPLGSEVETTPLPANVSLRISAIPERLMVGDELAVYINIENQGPGKAYSLVVSAPIPNGFELVGKETGWTVGDMEPFSKVPAMVYVLRAKTPGDFTLSGIRGVYYNESGGKVEVLSTPEVKLRVYGVPEIHAVILGSNSTFGGFGSYVHTTNGSPVTVLINITALGEKPEFEYVSDLTLHMDYPAGVVGPAIIGIGNISAGNNVEKALQIRVLKTGRFPIKAFLTFKDPLGNTHELGLGTVLVIDTIPPKVIVEKKTVKVYPSEEELPAVINSTLKNSNNSKEVAKRIQEVISNYLPEKRNYWQISTIVLLILVLILTYLTYGYYREVQIFRKFLLRKRKTRPGGLPKKWKRDELEDILREIRMETVREHLSEGNPGKRPPM